MFGPLGVPEILFILVLALLIFGPRRLPDVGRTLGKAMGEFRRASTELKRSINTEMALEDEDEKPRYTRTARPERGAGEGECGAKSGGQRAPKEEAPPRRDEGGEGEGGDEAAAQPGTVPRSGGEAPRSVGDGSLADRDPEA